MRIALLYHQFITRGGLEGYLREFSSRLHGAGHELLLCGCRVDEAFRKLSAEVHLIPPALSSLGTLRRFAERSAAALPDLKADLVLGFGRTWTQDIHRAGGGSHWHYSRMLPWWKRWKAKNRWELKAERRLYTGGGTRLFVVNSAKVREELAEAYQVPGSRVRVIHTAVDSARWRPASSPDARARLREQLGMDLEAGDGSPPSTAPRMEAAKADGPVFLFASLDHRRKGLRVLLQALRGVPGASLWVAGRELDGQWRREIHRLGLSGRVTGVGRADLLPYFQAADWFVHPTQYDACANTVLQSMACGLPGIISAGDGAVEFVRHGDNGLILQNPASAEELAGHLQSAAASSLDHRARLAAAARETVLPLTWAAHLEGWMRAIADMRAGF